MLKAVRSNLWNPVILTIEAGSFLALFPQKNISWEKIWVWFRAVRFVMCRQPQQKSGSKQPWSTRYDHQTEEAMPLGGPGRQGRREGKVGLELLVASNLPQSWRNTSSWLTNGGETGVWGDMLRRKRSGPKATNPRTVSKSFLFCCAKLRILWLDKSLVYGEVFQLG